MPLKIVVATSVTGDVYELVLTKDKYLVGRRHDNDLRIKETYISGYHSELHRTGNGDFELVDLGSANGTFLNGDQVQAPVKISAGDFIKFGILKVSVEEHAETKPNVVSLKDRPVFAEKNAQKTPEVALAEGKSENPNGAKGAARVAGLEKQLASVEADLKAAQKNLEKESPDRSTMSSKLKDLKSGRVKAEAAAKATIEKDKKIERLQKELAALKSTVSKKESELSSTAKEAAKVATLVASVTALEKQIATAKSDSEADTEKLQTELGKASTLAQKSSEKLQALKQEKSKLSKQLKSKEVELKKGETQIVLLTAEVKEKAAAAENAQDETRDAARLGRQIDALTSELDSTKADLKSAGTGSTQTRKEQKAATKRIADLEASLEKEGSEKTSLELKLERQVSELATTKNQLEEESKIDSNGKIEESKKQNVALKSQLESLTVERDDLGKAHAAATEKVEARLVELETKLNTASGEKNQLAGETAAQIADIESDHDTKISGLKEQIAALSASLKEETSSAENTANRLVGTLATIDKVNEEKASFETELAALRNECSTLRKNAAELGAELDSTETARGELEVALEKENRKATGSSAENDSLTSGLAKATTQLANARNEVEGLRSRNDEISKNNGRLHAQLSHETTEKSQLVEDLAGIRSKADDRLIEIDSLQQKVAAKERELAETLQQHARSESDTVQDIKRELSAAMSGVEASRGEVAQAIKEKQSLSGSYQRLQEQLASVEADGEASRVRESELLENATQLSDYLDKSEASNAELAARIKEEASNSIAGRNLITKLESQLRENESESVRREREQAQALQSEIESLAGRLEEEARQRNFVDESLARESAEKQNALSKILGLEERLVEFESTTTSMRETIKEGERIRSQLETDLAENIALAANHARISADLETELAATITRSQATENSLLEKHRLQVDNFLEELRAERDQKNALIIDLRNTKGGMSEAIRFAKEHGEREKAEIQAEGQAKLSEAEEELSLLIHSREGIEKARNELEDELNIRDEKIDRLGEQVEDVELQLRDENELRDQILADLETTRAGFSRALQSTHGHLAASRSAFSAELSAREDADATIAEHNREIARLRSYVESEEARYSAETRVWEDRFNKLREEKLTLSSENTNLKKLRDQIEVANVERDSVEAELSGVKAELLKFAGQRKELAAQREALLSEREEMKAVLNHARSELETTKTRHGEAERQAVKFARTIEAAEKRILSLKKLESEIEQAVERKRQQRILSRDGVFSNGAAAAEVVIPQSSGVQEGEFYRKLISKLDLLDDLTKRYDNKWRYPKVADQLSLLKQSFLDLLNDHSVRAFDLKPGTVLSVNERRKIKLVPLPENGARENGNSNGSPKNQYRSKVVETVRPGYIYQQGSKDIVIRKAEVIVA